MNEEHDLALRFSIIKILNRFKSNPWAILTAAILVVSFTALIATNHQRGTQIASAQSSASSASNGASQIQGSNHASALSSGAAAVATSTPSTARMIIEQASLSLVTPNVHAATDKVEQMTADDGGFVQSLTESSAENSVPTLNLTIRIPETDFKSFLSNTQGIGTVKNFSQTGQDVTEQYQNLQDNLTELENESQAYTRLYKKAQSMQDMLQIQKSLSQVNSQIADLQSQEHNLSRSVRLATVNLTLTANGTTTAIGSPITHALLQSLSAVKSSALALVTFAAWVLPWGVIALIVWGVIRLRRRKKTKA